MLPFVYKKIIVFFADIGAKVKSSIMFLGKLALLQKELLPKRCIITLKYNSWGGTKYVSDCHLISGAIS